MNVSIASQIAFSLASGEAQALHSKYIDVEHLALGLFKIEDILLIENSAIPALKENEWLLARREIQSFKDLLSDKGVYSKKARRRLRKILHESEFERGDFSGHRTPRCREVFTIANSLCKNKGSSNINLELLFSSVLRQKSHSLDLLFSELSTERIDLLSGLEENLSKEDDHHSTISGEKPHEENQMEKDSQQPLKTKTPLIDKWGRDITQLAKDGKLDPTIGRSSEIKKIAQTLIQKKKNSPILIGESGVGKTNIVEGFAVKAAATDALPQIRDFRIIELNMGSLIAGTKYRGEFEERLDALLKEAASDPNIVLFIDEIHTIVGAGAAGGALDAGNILKPVLAKGAIKCIGATTITEYRKYIEKDAALERRFQIIWIDEPTKEETILILKGLKQRFENHYMIKIPDEVTVKAVELSMRYLTDFRLPDKAIDILDQACAKTMLQSFSPANADDRRQELRIEDVARVVSERCRISIDSLTTDETERLLKIEEYLCHRIKGQDYAIKEISDTIRSARAGLKDPNKPVIFLLAGSTGTGKTELAKALAEFMSHDESCLIAFDMSEYQEKHSVAKLIGSPPGYIGHEEEGQLTGKVRTYPYSVILFDEIEKAHSDVFDLFLQIFEEGRLTDSHGRRVNFSESVIILTSNLGNYPGSVQGLINKQIGFNVGKRNLNDQKDKTIKESHIIPDDRKKWKDYENRIRQAINSTFRPELLNRIQKTIIFYPLSLESVKQIIDEKILSELNKRLISRGIKIVLLDEALNFLLQKGYSGSNGVREIQRCFDEHISEPLSSLILKGNMKSGQIINVGVVSEKIHFSII